ncbi:MAG: hypothetical protein R3E53_07520 [Myxococcota bacterium]
MSPIPGAMATLLLAVGQNLARFRADSLFRGEGMALVRSTLTRYMLPYFVILVLYLTAKGQLDVPCSFIRHFFEDRAGTFLSPSGSSRVFFQVALVLAATFAIPPLRDAIAARPLAWGAGAFAAALGAHVLANQTDTWLPPVVLWSGIVALGWCVQFARDVRERIALSLVALVTPLARAARVCSWAPCADPGLDSRACRSSSSRSSRASDGWARPASRSTSCTRSC